MPKGYEVLGNTLRVYFRWNGELCRESLPDKATPATIEHAKRLAAIINYEIDADIFDYARHFPNSTYPQENSFGYYLDLWLTIKKNELAFSTFRGYVLDLPWLCLEGRGACPPALG